MSDFQEDPPLPQLSAIFPHLEQEPTTLPDGLDPFTITTKTGFLPSRAPLVDLPAEFNALSSIINDMPVTKLDGTPGLLAEYKLCSLIDSGALPDLTLHVRSLCNAPNPNMELITALFRDYSFLASSYLLEPCWQTWNKDPSNGYGLGREILPRCIAGPLMRTAELLDIPAFMSYAASYALYNYRLVDPKIGPSEYSNLRLIRAFEYGLDPKSSEAGFILTHINMVQETGPLVSGAASLLNAVETSSPTAAKSAFQTMLTAMAKIEAAMENMWSHSLPKDYISYRTFIFGITSQSMFPNGVVYEGENDGKPLYFRGESGANDSIIPLLDYLCEIPMPKNPLTDILVDFRRYRPKPHRQFLGWVMSKAAEVRVREFCIKDLEVAQLYLKLLDHVRSFRWRHWLFAREYIIKRTAHPTATGGSPIVTWLPNQLMAVMKLQEEVYHKSGLKQKVEAGGGNGLDFVKKLMDNVKDSISSWTRR
ncbi:Indoleamine 2,3-dioxygenase 1 [Cyphellophora attinorum]|uniref:Indoleamine 2,3-dioxygenase n=1 Tax=Cyphellophora attinorum TaxID=1664694 RepID=A0A0N1GWV5_9EURO|nr:Indoleamine 2,3-dioxygenase 1 [Phialophora attinorum]KPI34506.1 Indoleamine 2,3-dioxygenase 1 [Phialophora attinorum]